MATLAAGHRQQYLSSSQLLAAQYRLNSQLKPLEGAECGGRWVNRALSGPCAFLWAREDATPPAPAPVAAPIPHDEHEEESGQWKNPANAAEPPLDKDNCHGTSLRFSFFSANWANLKHQRF